VEFPGLFQAGTKSNGGLLIQRDFQFLGDLMRIERAAGEKTSIDANRGHLAAAVVNAHYEFLGIGRLVNVHFLKCDLSLAKELFHAAAVAAPAG
jgi:hypothetical protein